MSNKMWGGRFSVGPAEIMEEINASVDFDRKLAQQDIAGSKAHVAMLASQGIVEAADAEAFAAGLDAVKGELEAGTFVFSRALEDIHMNVESRLAARIGAPAGRRPSPGPRPPTKRRRPRSGRGCSPGSNPTGRWLRSPSESRRSPPPGRRRRPRSLVRCACRGISAHGSKGRGVSARASRRA